MKAAPIQDFSKSIQLYNKNMRRGNEHCSRKDYSKSSKA